MKITKLLPLIGIAIFAFILSRLDLSSVLLQLRSVKPLFFILALGVGFLSITLKGYKWRVLIQSYGSDYPLLKCMSAWLVAFFISLLTPAKVGDLARAVYVNRETEMSLGNSIGTVIVDRVIDIVALFAYALVGISVILWKYPIPDQFTLLFVIGLVFFIGAVYFASRKHWMGRLLKPVFNILVPEKHKEKMRVSFHDFYDGLSNLRGKKMELGKVMMATFATWFLTFIQLYLLILALGLDVTFWFVVWISPVALLIEILPISFSGLGTREAVLIVLLGIVAIPATSAVSFSLLILLMNYTIALAGVALWIKKPLQL